MFPLDYEVVKINSKKYLIKEVVGCALVLSWGIGRVAIAGRRPFALPYSRALKTIRYRGNHEDVRMRLITRR